MVELIAVLIAVLIAALISTSWEGVVVFIVSYTITRIVLILVDKYITK